MRQAVRGWAAIPHRAGLVALMVLALLHGMAYAVIVPVWQAPDETTIYEYTQLIVELGRLPQYADRSPALEERLIASMERQRFWAYAEGPVPATLPHTLAEVQAVFDMPRQVGGDPPAYFVLAALPLGLVQGWPPERQVLLLRMLNVLLLPGIVACAYGAAREVPGESPAFALAVAGLVALQPMLMFIGASMSNDGLANLLGAALCWASLRLLRRGFSRRRAALLLGLLALALLTKRTTLPYLALLPVLAWVARRPTDDRRPTTADRRPPSTGGHRPPTTGGHRPPSTGGHRGPALQSRGSQFSIFNFQFSIPLLGAALVAIWLGRQLDLGAAANWLDDRSYHAAPRASVEGRPGAALLVRAGAGVIQPLPSIAGDMLRGQALRYGAHVWSDAAASGRLVVITDDQRQEFPFEVSGPLDLEVRAVLSEQARGVRLGLLADTGSFYADDLWAGAERLPGNLIANGRVELPAVQPGTPLSAALRYLRLREIAWTLGSGRLTQPLAHSDVWAGLLFSSFWGYFGWMRVPYVGQSLWMPLLAACCALGVLGCLRRLLWRQGETRQRRQVLALLLLPVAALAVLALNAYALPSVHVRQQGRYLFPVLVPIACVVALGQSALLPQSWQRAWLAGWFAFWLVFASATLIYLMAYYGR